MALSFERVKEIFLSYGLESHTIKNGECTEFSFKDKVINYKQKNVATRIEALQNGGVGGYIYVDHLKEYDFHPRKTKMGHIPIGEMTEAELKETIEKVIKDYRYKRVAANGLILALAGGLAKLFLGLSRGKPVGFLVLELFAVAAVFIIFSRPPLVTEAGKAYIAAMKKKYPRFSKTGTEVGIDAQDSRPFDDFFIPLSLYGAMYLSDNYQTAPFADALENYNRHRGGFDNGTEGSCSSYDGGSCSGGSSCSGAGSGCSGGGGGGCGGCGGN